MPHPLTTTLLAVAVLALLVGAPAFAVGFIAGLSLWLEVYRFWINGVDERPKQQVLVRSGEELD